MRTLHSKLKLIRQQHNLTQEELADKVGVVRQTIAYLERGEYVPSLALAWDIATVLKVRIEDIFSFQK